jgi:Tol biopolymer transport system component
MKTSSYFIAFLIFFLSCDKEKTDPKRVLPDYLQSSRTVNSIKLSWNSPLILMEVSPDIYERSTYPDSYELFLSIGDTLNFELVKKFSRDLKQYVYPENKNGLDYFFKLNCLAKGAVSSHSNIVWINGGLNPELTFLLDFKQNNSTVGDVSTDESKILINRYPSGGGSQGIALYDLNTKIEHFIVTNAESAAFSSDEKWIAFTSYFGDYSMKPDGRNLGLINIETGEIDTLTTGPYTIYSPVFSNYDSVIYFHNSPYNVEDQIIKVKLADKSIDTIFNSATSLRFQRISYNENKQQIFMTTFQDNGHRSISAYDISSNSIYEVIDGTTWFDSYPSISPNGKYLAFYSQRSGRNEIWVLNLDNFNYHQLTGEEDRNFRNRIVWSKSGEKIYVIGNKANSKALYSFSLSL